VPASFLFYRQVKNEVRAGQHLRVSAIHMPFQFQHLSFSKNDSVSATQFHDPVSATRVVDVRIHNVWYDAMVQSNSLSRRYIRTIPMMQAHG
jgi:hypothetical protein